MANVGLESIGKISALLRSGCAPDQSRHVTEIVGGSEFIETLEQARAYYRAKLAGSHAIQVHGRDVTVVFEKDMTHAYSEESGNGELVTRYLGGGRRDVRHFSRERAQLLDHVLRAISLFVFSVPGTGRAGNAMRMLHGPALPGGQHLRVVLRPGPGDAWTCVSAYPVTSTVFFETKRARSAKFP